MTSQGTVAKYLSEEGLGERARRCRWKFYKRLEEPKEGERNRHYVSLPSRLRWGSGTIAVHSTQRTLPALCSSSVTLSEIRRLWVQAPGRSAGGSSGWISEAKSATMHLQGS